MTLRSGVTWLPSALLLLQVPGCLTLSGPEQVTGTVGGSLSVQCRYERQFKENNKYWCKSPCLASLRTKIVETTKSEREVRSGRVSIRDHPATLTFTVTLESLTESDGGTYRCGIHRPWTEGLIDLTFQVEVSVSPGCLSLSCPRRVTGTVGGSLSVQCRYEKKYTDHNKYWCKGPWLPPLTRKTVETTESQREVRSGRVSIRDHPATLTFTVTLESLTEGDGGTYWCGMDRPWTEEPFVPTFPVVVSVSPGCLSLSGPEQVTGTVGGSLSVQCRYEKKYTDHNKYWCKSPCLPSLRTKIVETTESQREVRSGRVSIRDHPATLTFTVTLESLTESDGGTYRCGIDTPWTERLIHLTFPVEVSVVSPGESHTPSPRPCFRLPDLPGHPLVRTDMELKSWLK
ncbi:polymeric immunoglobulin receptor-like isoform X2 [Myotis daubentonii]|uniref:polymeric immunoglobulin receptor-like isoform X2 n=1 Tax=Myotis daubentonii TaxID=98922 RepID=UPI002873BA93|nr:polymeric immunoglobulin receptor-like isoform X2 [Myotis daubentonii]